MLNVSSGVEMLTGSWSKDRQFRSFMVKLASEFKRDDLLELKYALQKDIPAGKLESLEKPLEFFKELEQRGMVGPGNFHELRCTLENLDKLHLCSMIDEFDDSCSVFPLKAKSENFLGMDGYRLAVKGGRHFETSDGEFVEVRSGANYGLTITNLNCHRCIVRVRIDGYDMFVKAALLNPKHEWTIERPSREAKKFKFYAVTDAPSGSGINKWRKDENGVIEVVFTPERADMKIVCVAQGAGNQVLTCSDQMTDSEFYRMVLESFGATNATIMMNGWQPLHNRDLKLSEYGITNGSRVTVNLGGRGGVNINALPSIRKTTALKKDVKWRAGATTLNGESDQKFHVVKDFPVDPDLAVSLNLRLVARDDERALRSTGNSCMPLARATVIPPPVPN